MGMLNRKPTLSIERVALAEAIAARDAYQADVAATTSALATAEDGVRQAAGRVTDASLALDAAKIAVAAHMVALARGAQAEAPATSMRTLRAVLTDAEDELGHAKAARDALGSRSAELEGAYLGQKLADDCKAAALKVIASEVDTTQLSSLLTAAQERLLDVAFVARWLVRAGVVPARGAGSPRTTPALASLDRMLDQPPSTWTPTDAVRWNVSAASQQRFGPWDAALAGLLTDAAMPLPTLPLTTKGTP